MASIEGTKKFASKFGEIPAESFRDVAGLSLSSIGIGTYLGNADADTDERYHDSVVAFAEAGGNVIDTASNYRFQRSERSIGRALRTLSEKGFDREEFFISTKGGYLPFDTVIPPSVEEYFDVTFVKPGIAKPEDLASGSHCMTPKFLKSQIDQSLINLGIEHIDLYYIHNPETDLQESDRYTLKPSSRKHSRCWSRKGRPAESALTESRPGMDSESHPINRPITRSRGWLESQNWSEAIPTVSDISNSPTISLCPKRFF